MENNRAMVESEDAEIIQVTEVVDNGALATLNTSEINQQIATARQFPRTASVSKKRALDIATLDQATAAACSYLLPRGGKKIEGPSVRLAEIVACAWGNMRVGARIVDIGRNFVTAQGFAHDLENNLAVYFESKRRITKRNGDRFDDDMIGVTANAACAIARRNAIFQVVPLPIVNAIRAECKKVAMGSIKSLSESRAKAVEYFKANGVAEDRILAAFDKKSIEDLTLEDVVDMQGMYRSIKANELTLNEAFPPVEVSKETRTEEVLGKVNAQAEKQQSAQHTEQPLEKSTAKAEPAKTVTVTNGELFEDDAVVGGAARL